MLNIIIEGNHEEIMKRLPDRISNVSAHFDFNYEPEWFSDPLVRRIIGEIDKTKVIHGINLYNETLLGLSPASLSSGSKTLILLLKEDYIINGDRLGDNCMELLLDIAEQKDITITTSHILPLPKQLKVKTSIHGYGEADTFEKFLNAFVTEVYGGGESWKTLRQHYTKNA
ncbi:MAG: DUF4869 domain-containing protein [Ruminococcus sp.]|nr:DUF4869 domain-containing protein [Ruminococcus sp.]